MASRIKPHALRWLQGLRMTSRFPFESSGAILLCDDPQAGWLPRVLANQNNVKVPWNEDIVSIEAK